MPGFDQIVRAVREYRTKYPDKPFVYAGESRGAWRMRRHSDGSWMRARGAGDVERSAIARAWLAAAQSLVFTGRHEGSEVANNRAIELAEARGDVMAAVIAANGVGMILAELGELDPADVTVTTDYVTARALFVDQDQAASMQAFMAGKIKVQGDMMKMMAMQTSMPQDDIARAIAGEIQAITE